MHALTSPEVPQPSLGVQEAQGLEFSLQAESFLGHTYGSCNLHRGSVKGSLHPHFIYKVPTGNKELGFLADICQTKVKPEGFNLLSANLSFSLSYCWPHNQSSKKQQKLRPPLRTVSCKPWLQTAATKWDKSYSNQRWENGGQEGWQRVDWCHFNIKQLSELPFHC